MTARRPPLSLVRTWYRKAQGGDFRDLEIPTASGNLDARMRTTVRTDPGSLLVRDGPARAEYYRLAGAFLHHHRFMDARERTIWDQHASGLSVEATAQATGVPHTTVQRTIERLSALMLEPRGKRGRPPKPDGRGNHAFSRHVRFTTQETDAIFFIAEHSKCSRLDAIRMAILAYAKAIRISGTGKSGTAVPGGGTER